MDSPLPCPKELLEDFPHSPRSLKKSETKTLQFSDRSTLHLYEEDYLYAKTKSYSESERERFNRDAIQDAVQIMKLLRQSNTDPRQLLKKGFKNTRIPPSSQLKEFCVEDETIGLEHLVLEDPRSRNKRRTTHRQAVLMEHAEQVKEGYNDIHSLAELSSMLSRRAESQARERATRVAQLSNVLTNRPTLQARNRAARAA